MNVSKESKILNFEDNKEEEQSLVNDEEFEKFQNVLSRELVLELYSLFKLFEKKGLINYKIYIESMIEIFKKYNKNKSETKYKNNFKEIFDLIFNRFQKIKCIMKNHKKVFYLTNMVPQNQIETYTIVCFLTIFIKCRIIDKIKLLFELTDIDDDGFLNKAEIKQMISTINFMFSEENTLIDINSSILAQSLMNLNVKQKISKLMNIPGDLNKQLEKEKYIDFDTFYNSLIKIKNYKYEIIPCFINMKQCLYKKRTEKILEVKNKNKKEFVRASSAISSEFRPGNPFKRYKRNFSANNLGRIIKNVRINKENNLKILKKKELLLGIKEKNKSFKDLLKESTIFSDEENEEEIGGKSFDELGVSYSSKKISFHNTTKDKPFYIFEADFDKIKKIEVQPALLKFSKNEKENEKMNIKIGRYQSTFEAKTKDLSIPKNNLYKRYNHMSAKGLDFKNYLNPKNSDISKNINIFNKRGNILSINERNNEKNTLYNNFHRQHSFNLHNRIFNSNNTSKLINYKNLRHNSNTILKDLKDNSNKSNNINNINKRNMNKINKKNNNKRPFSSSNNKIIRNKSNIVEIKPNTIEKKFNRFKYKRKNFNKIFNRNKIKKKVDTTIIDKYLSANDIFKDVDKNEEKLRHERTEYFGKELVALYKKMIREKKEIRSIVGKYDKYHISLNFFDFKKKTFPKDYGKSIFSSNKYYY